MTTSVANALEQLRSLGSLAEVRAEAEELSDIGNPPSFNTHIHLPPNFSAFETVEQAVDLAREQGLRVLGVSNYYDFSVYADFVSEAQQAGIFPLFGLEIICLLDDLRQAGVKINDPGNPGKMYLCGKGITRFAEMTDAGSRLLGMIRENDATRMAAMTERMSAVFAERGYPTGITTDDVIEMVVQRHGRPRETVYLQERHIAQAFARWIEEHIPADQRIEAINQILGATTKAAGPDDTVTIQGDLRSHLMKAGKPAFVEETFVSFAEARQLVLELGGIPTYPTLVDGTSPVCPFEETPATLIEQVTRRGVHAAEFISNRNSAAVLSEYVPAMRAAGLVITAGTEHNTLDLDPLQPICQGGEAWPDEVAAIFWEGACVVAAHQFLTLHGEVGYVDTSGQPNPDYQTPDQRITSLARIGAVVMRRFAD